MLSGITAELMARTSVTTGAIAAGRPERAELAIEFLVHR
jgi:hypothetical protein